MWVDILKVVIILNLIFFLLMAFFIKKKQLHPFENLFLLFMLEFMITSYVGILYVNLQVWDISEKVHLYLIFRLNQVILTPLLYLWAFNLVGSKKRNKLEIIKISTVFILLIYFLEFLLVRWKIIEYINWHAWQSILILSFMMFLSYLLLLSFRKRLSKEGVHE